MEAHLPVHHSTLGSRVIAEEKIPGLEGGEGVEDVGEDEVEERMRMSSAGGRCQLLRVGWGAVEGGIE